MRKFLLIFLILWVIKTGFGNYYKEYRTEKFTFLTFETIVFKDWDSGCKVYVSGHFIIEEYK